MPLLEGAFNKKMRDRFWELKMWSHKTADRFTKGIPDIYLGQGCWIESKMVPVTMYKRRSYLGEFDVLQRELMDDLIKVGDTPTVALYCQGCNKSQGNEEHLVIMHWEMFKKVPFWDVEIVRFWGHEVKSTYKWPLELYYSRERAGIFKPERNLLKWADYEQRFPTKDPGLPPHGKKGSLRRPKINLDAPTQAE